MNWFINKRQLCDKECMYIDVGVHQCCCLYMTDEIEVQKERSKKKKCRSFLTISVLISPQSITVLEKKHKSSFIHERYQPQAQIQTETISVLTSGENDSPQACVKANIPVLDDKAVRT